MLLMSQKYQTPYLSNEELEDDGQTIVKEKQKVEKPPMYMVLLHNDDYTTMEFVIEVLMKFFKKTKGESTSIMLQIHNEGKSRCGIYTKEVAESKVDKVERYARRKGHPLKSSFEPCGSE